MSASNPILYRACKGILRAALHVYFSRIERFHPERVPEQGPVLFASNHPNSLTDAFVIGASVRRKVNFVATVQLFRFPPLRWLLLRCGVIPINRVKDDPRAMRSVLSTFEACFKVLEQGEAIAIFPEGITHDDPQLKTVKTGAARMALEFEQRQGGNSGLRIVPVGLSFSGKEKYRSEVLVHYGDPILVAEFARNYAGRKHECIQVLNGELERRIQALMVHLPRLERARIVEAVKSLYLDQLRVGNAIVHEPLRPLSEELVLTQAIARAVDFAFERHPERAAAFVRRLRRYDALVQKLKVDEELLKRFPRNRSLVTYSVSSGAIAILAAPFAAYGWIHRFLPYAILRRVIHASVKTPADKTHVSTAVLVGGLVIFTLFYGAYAAVCAHFFGWRVACVYAASLPVASMAAHYYLLHLGRFVASLRLGAIQLRAPAAAGKLRSWRAQLVEEIEFERGDFLEASQSGPPLTRT